MDEQLQAISAFVTALHNFGLDLDEATSLSLAMVRPEAH